MEEKSTNNSGALKEINEVFSDLAKDALAIAIVTKEGTVAYHYAANGHMSQSIEDASFVIDMIKQLHATKEKG